MATSYAKRLNKSSYLLRRWGWRVGKAPFGNRLAANKPVEFLLKARRVAKRRKHQQ
jgi:hypothetical protein